MTVVRRPLQSMVCSGRLTICDQKSMARARNRIRCRVNRAHVLSLCSSKRCATNSGYFGAIYQQLSRRRCNRWQRLCGGAYLIEVFNAALAIKHARVAGNRRRRRQISTPVGFQDGENSESRRGRHWVSRTSRNRAAATQRDPHLIRRRALFLYPVPPPANIRG